MVPRSPSRAHFQYYLDKGGQRPQQPSRRWAPPPLPVRVVVGSSALSPACLLASPGARARRPMEELAPVPAAAQGEKEAADGEESAPAWRAVAAWLAVLLRLLFQIVGGAAPSLAGALAFVRHRHPMLRTAPQPGGGSVAFRPLPVEPPPEEEMVKLSPGSSLEGLDRLTVVLDLDETLVCAYESSCLPANVHSQAMKAGLKCFELECFSEGKQKVNHVTVFERPGLEEFLLRISEFAELVLFTAGLEGYARPLVDKIDAKNRFSLRFYRSSTVSTKYREHVKDLSCLSKDLSRVVIVDNNPFSFLLQPSNGIPCIPFSPRQPYDDQLLSVLLPLLRHLSLQKDVRPALYEKFHMPEWFQQHGILANECT